MQRDDERGLAQRVIRFGVSTLVTMLTPFVVLPIVADRSGPTDWTALAVGQSVGSLAGLVVACGWPLAGPVELARAVGDDVRRLFFESLLTRSTLLLAALGPVALICWLVAPSGRFGLTAVTAVAFATLALSSNWVAVGLGDPVRLVVLESLPRLLVLLAAGLAIRGGADLLVYPMAMLAGSAMGLVLFCLAGVRPRRPATSLSALLRARLPVQGPALSTMLAAGGYTAATVLLVSLATDVHETAVLSTAQLLHGVGLFGIVALSNALQVWVVQADPVLVRERMLRAMAWHTALGLIGFIGYLLVVPSVAARLFGADLAPGTGVAFGYGATFCLVSIGTCLAQHILVPHGALRSVLRATLAGALVGVPLILLLAHRHGAVGGAVALAVSELVVTILLACAAYSFLAVRGTPGLVEVR